MPWSTSPLKGSTFGTSRSAASLESSWASLKDSTPFIGENVQLRMDSKIGCHERGIKMADGS